MVASSRDKQWRLTFKYCRTCDVRAIQSAELFIKWLKSLLVVAGQTSKESNKGAIISIDYYVLCGFCADAKRAVKVSFVW